MSDSVTPWTAARQTSLSITNSQSLFRFMSVESVMPSNHLILCRPLFLLPSIFPSIKVFSNESVLHIRWTKYWSFSFSISPSSEYSGLISSQIDWLDLLAPKWLSTFPANTLAEPVGYISGYSVQVQAQPSASLSILMAEQFPSLWYLSCHHGVALFHPHPQLLCILHAFSSHTLGT